MSIPLIKKILIKSISLVSIILPWHINPAMADETEIKTGDPAPAFTLYDQHNKQRSITDYQGKWLIIYFYPKDDTPGCTQEACHFRDDIYKIRELNAEVIGISIDNILSHKAFSEKFNLPFPLLADPNGITARQYGAFFSLGPVKFAKRHSFIVDPRGKIAKIYRDVDTQTHSQEIISAITQLANDVR